MAPALFERGFEHLPVSGKKLVDKGWTTMVINARTIDDNAQNGRGDMSVGIRLGKLHAVGVDIYDHAMAVQLLENLECLTDGQPWYNVSGSHLSYLSRAGSTA